MPDFNKELKDYILTQFPELNAGYIYGHPPIKDSATQIVCILPSGEYESPVNNWHWQITKTLIVSGTEQTALEKAHEIWRKLVPLRPENNGFATTNFAVHKASTDQKPSLLLIDPQGDVAYASFRIKFILAES